MYVNLLTLRSAFWHNSRNANKEGIFQMTVKFFLCCDAQDYADNSLRLFHIKPPPHLTLKDKLYCCFTLELRKAWCNHVEISCLSSLQLVMQDYALTSDECCHVQLALRTVTAELQLMTVTIHHVKWQCTNCHYCWLYSPLSDLLFGNWNKQKESLSTNWTHHSIDWSTVTISLFSFSRTYNCIETVSTENSA
jgi:hypothetical protein